jgi:formate hydrogenlyase subunit 3/multisubunit Na+/H+ antiporter MnhD subunit
MSLELLLIIAFGGALLTYLVGKVSCKGRDFLAVAVSLALVVFVACLYGRSPERTFYSGFLGIPFILRLNMLSWFFAITIVGIGLLSIIYSLEYVKKEERLDYYYFTMLFINASMLGTVISGDLI